MGKRSLFEFGKLVLSASIPAALCVCYFLNVGGARETIQSFASRPPHEKSLTLSSAQWALGTVPSGPTYTHSVLVTNNEPDAVELLSVKSSCGCTVPEIAQKHLKSGESTEVSIKLSSYGRSGNYVGKISVLTTSKEKPVLDYGISAYFKLYEGELVTVPSQIEWSEIAYAKGARRTVAVRRLGEDPLRIEEVRCNVPGIEVVRRLDAIVNAPYESAVYDIVVPPTMPAGRFEGTVEILTSHSVHSRAEIPLIGNVVERLRVYPTQLYFNLSSGTSVSAELALSCSSGEQLQLSDIQLMPREFPARVSDPVCSGSKCRIIVTADPALPASATSATLEIRTTLPMASTLTIPLTAWNMTAGK